MKAHRTALAVIIAAALAPVAALATENTSPGNAYYVLPDGVLQSDFIPATLGGQGDAGVPQWFVIRLEARRSYVFEVVSRGMFQTNAPPQPVPTFFENDGTTALAGIQLAELSYCDPKVGDFAQVPIRRHSLVNNTDTAKFAKVRITSGLNFQTAEVQPFEVRLIDTSIASARWTTNNYTSFVGLHNRQTCSLTYYINYYNEAGVLLQQISASIPGRGSVQVKKDATDPVLGGQRGAVEVLHTGAAGDVVGFVYGVEANNAFILQFPLERRGYGAP